MRISGLSRRALLSCVAVAMFAGCGGSASNGVLPIGITPGSSLPHHRPFYYTGAAQYFTIPEGVTRISLVARGGGGARGHSDSHGGRGGRVHATIPVTPGEKLLIFVGGEGVRDKGGFNGGANGGKEESCDGGGGGGASDVRRGGSEPANRILVAGGGGGAGAFNEYSSSGPHGSGGRGGDTIGGAGAEGGGYNGGLPGTGGSQDQGGLGGGGGSGTSGSGDSGSNGSLARGGAGGAGCSNGTSSRRRAGGSGGGGGGGFYGGGGAGAGGSDYSYNGGGGGGGGGSSYAEPRAVDVHFWQGWKNATTNGLVVLSW